MKKSILGIVATMIIGTTSCLAHSNVSPDTPYRRCNSTVVVVKDCDRHCHGTCANHKRVSHKGNTRPVKNCACSTCDRLRRKPVRPTAKANTPATWRGTSAAPHTVVVRR